MSTVRFSGTRDFFVRRDSLLVAPRLRWRVVEKADSEYPSLLRNIDDPPDRLWVAGRDLAKLEPFLAVVGSRRANGYGLQIARDLAADLSQHGACVVSGLALGVDGAAHEGALAVGGSTVAVLGCGVNVCYPARNSRLYEEIADKGALVSELPPDTPARGFHFPKRNRIIAGMSSAVIVVQAGAKSGALITGRLALDAGRDVFAVPGQIDWPLSVGVHGLLRDGATPCTGAGDVIAQLSDRLRFTPAEDLPVPEHFPAEQRRVLEIISAGAATRESVCAASGLDPATTARALVALEVAGFVKEVPGARMRRVR